MNAPLPLYKGLFVELATAKRVHAFFLQHDPDAGETPADDCFLTVSELLTGGLEGCGESGLYPVADFRNGFKFLSMPQPGKTFGT